jgi:hypothetical protein
MLGALIGFGLSGPGGLIAGAVLGAVAGVAVGSWLFRA